MAQKWIKQADGTFKPAGSTTKKWKKKADGTFEEVQGVGTTEGAGSTSGGITSPNKSGITVSGNQSGATSGLTGTGLSAGISKEQQARITAEENILKQYGSYEQFQQKNATDNKIAAALILAPGATSATKNTLEKAEQGAYEKLIQEEQKRLMSGSDFYGMTNKTYQEYLDNLKENAKSQEQLDWLEKQKNNLDAMSDKEIRGLVADYVEGSWNILEYMKKYDSANALKRRGYSEEEIKSMADTYKREQNAAEVEHQAEMADELTDSGFGGKVAAQIMSAGAGIASVPSVLENVKAAAKEIITGEYTPPDTNTIFHAAQTFKDRTMSNIESDITGREEAAEKGEKVPAWKEALGMMYQGGSSAVDSILMAPFGGAGVGLMAAEAAGSSAKDAFERTGSNTKSLLTGTASGIIEYATEKMGLDNLWDIMKNSGKAAARNTFVNILAQAGIEGVEEMTSETLNTLFDWFINQADSNLVTNKKGYEATGMSEKEAWGAAAVDALKQIGTAGATGAFGGLFGGAFASVVSPKLSKNEKAVVDAETETRIAEKEKDGTKLKAKEKAAIREQVEADLAKGYISIDTIEKTLGGETYEKYKAALEQEETLRKEYDTLNKMKQGEMTGEQLDRRAELKEQLKELEKSSNKEELKKQLSREVKELAGNDEFLRESYNEGERRRVAYQIDESVNYSKKQREIVQKAADSGILNNTRRTHEFVDLVARLAADKGVSFDFTDNQRLKESGFAIGGKHVNGFVKDGTITVNIESNQALDTVVGHEITHVLEGTKLYSALQQAVQEYAKVRGEYDSRLAELTELYKGVEGANVENELTAELVGEYLFSDPDFVNQLAKKNRNLFQKLFREIRYMAKIATAGSREAQKLEELKRAFERAYRESNGTKAKSGVQYSVEKFSNDYDAWDKKNPTQVFEVAVTSDALKSIGIEEKSITMDSSKLLKIKAKHPGMTDAVIKNIPSVVNEPMLIMESKQSTSRIVLVGELVDANGKNVLAILELNPASRKGVALDEIKIASAYGKDNLQNFINTSKILYVNPDNTKTSRWLTSTGLQLPVESSTAGSTTSVPQNQQNASGNSKKSGEVRYSLSNNSEVTQSSEFKQWFGDWQNNPENASKVVNADGTPKVVYHGTGSQFTIFDLNKTGSRFGEVSEGLFFFTNKRSGYADSASDYARGTVEKGGTPRIVEAYLNIKNPLRIDSKGYYTPVAYFDQNYEAVYDEYLAGEWDGIIIENSEKTMDDSVIYMVDNPKQIKSATDNIGTFDGSNPDIRYSLSAQDDIAPINPRLTYGSDIALEQDNTIPIRQDIAGKEIAPEEAAAGHGSNKNVDNQYPVTYNEHRPTEGNGGAGYARTDEFRRIQEECQKLYDNERELYHSGSRKADKNLLGRLSGVFKNELEACYGDVGNANGILTLSGKDSQFNLYQDVNGELFHDVFEIARSYLRNGELVDLHEANTTDDGIGYNDCTNYLSDDGLSGFSVTPDGDLISVFNASGRTGFLRAIAPIVKEKAKTLDCYASERQNLMEMYRDKFGFKTASIMDYNMAYDHDNIAENHGNPQVAFMVNTEADVEEKHFSKDQYDEAVDYRNSYINNQISPTEETSQSGAFFDGENADSDGIDGIIFESGEETSSPFDTRDIREVGSRKVNAYMYENPEVKPYFQEEARAMLLELKNTVKGEKSFNSQLYYDTNGEQGWFGTKRETSDAIAELMDDYGYSYSDIEKGLKAIIEDQGAENIAVSKRIEFFLDERLREGYTDFVTGMDIPPNQDYINTLETKRQAGNDTAGIPIRQDLPQAGTESGIPIRDDIAKTQDADPARSDNAVAQDTGETDAMGPIRSDISSESDTGRKGKMRKWVETATESEAVNREILPEDLDQELIHYEPVSNKKTIQQADADLERMGYDKALTVFQAKLESKRVSLSDVALGERLLQEAMKRGDKATAADLIQDIATLGTELGQKVQALSIIQRMTPEGQLKMLYKLVERGKAKGDKAFGGVEVTQDIANKILDVYKEDGSYDQSELNKAVEEAKQMIADQMPVSRMEKLNAWRYLSMLGNPKTHDRNIISNVTMKAAVAAKNALARTMETVLPVRKRTKTWRSATKTVREFAKQTTAEMAGVLSGENSYSETASIKSKRDVFKNKVLQKVYDFNSDMLTKEDWWFKRSAFRNAFREFLTANGIRTQEDINNHPETVEKAKKYAVEQAEIATFQQYSWLASKINDIERKNAATQMVVGAVIPFKKTPINIAKTGLSYSPLGFAKTLSYDLFQMKQGNMDASTVIDHLSQNMAGSALVYAGYMLAMSGLLNGGGEDDEEAKYDYQLGEQSYSINLGGATYSLSWLTPAAIPLFVGANVYEMFEEGKEFTFDTTADALAKTLDPMSEMSFLSSLDSVLSSYDSGMAKFAGIGEAMLQSYTSQFIPTLSSQIAATLDDTKRSTKASGDSTAEVPEETLRKLMYKIPGLRNLLEPSTDIWGNEVKQSDSLPVRAFESFLAPYAKRENIGTGIDEELKEVYRQTGDGSLLPKVPSGSVTFDNEKYRMSAGEYTAYKKTYGQTANKLLGELFATTAYRNADDSEKADMIGRVYDYARDEAKKEYLAKEGVEYTNAKKDKKAVYKEDKIKGAVENDMTLEEFDLFSKSKGKYYISKALGGIKVYDPYVSEINAIKGDKDASGNTVSGSRKNKVADYINSLPLSYEQKILLFTSVYPSEDSYKRDIIKYLSSRDDISYSEMVEILEELDCRVTDDGKVYW